MLGILRQPPWRTIVTKLIDRPDELERLCQDLGGREFIAVDTEFIRERTYYPRLCLIQVASGSTIACIDAIALTDLAPLIDLLLDPTITKVLHAARQDLEIFFHICNKIPAPLFDTQVAANLCGMGDQESLAALATRLLSVDAGKSHARTDWSRRPLSEEQLRYASDDVLFLLPIFEFLSRRLEDNGRTSWLEEDCLRLIDPGLYVVDPVLAWQRLRGLTGASAAQFHAARLLAQWREERAIRLDRPRGWVLKDDALLGIAAALPDSEDRLGRIAGVPSPLLRRESGALLELVSTAKKCDVPVPKMPEQLTDRQRKLVSRMMDTVRSTAAEIGVSAAALATRRDIKAIVQGDGSALPLHGWRRNVIGEKLLTMSGATG